MIRRHEDARKIEGHYFEEIFFFQDRRVELRRTPPDRTWSGIFFLAGEPVSLTSSTKIHELRQEARDKISAQNKAKEAAHGKELR